MQPEPATAWRIVTECHACDLEVKRATVHRSGCWGAREGAEVGSEVEARTAMARPGARGCVLCGTDQYLR
ncbi:DUF6233 domain-containing protein [Streptomyces clavifer]|uniref:DUF6233 domain-containing protein n=1 Tax=Streptomyces clavifer TaxID=68188 RepID=UPI00365E9EB2